MVTVGGDNVTMSNASRVRITAGEVKVVPIDSIQPYPGNARRGDDGVLDESLEEHGQYRSVVVQLSTSYIVAGNNTWRRMKEQGATEISAQFIDVDDERARRILLVDNRSNDKASYDKRLLAEMLGELPDLAGTGYELPDLEALEHELAMEGYGDLRLAEQDEGDAAGAKPRTSPLDLIFSWRPDSALALIAAQMGWGMGCISTAWQSARKLYERYPNAPRMTFMDNEWHGYQHALHRDAVAEIKPKYATVRDLVTRDQAEADDVEWYSLEHTLDMASEIAEHVDNVILIPKYDCLDRLPERIGKARVVLGYSVETSYGGTPLPIKAMAGRPIHLLGGAWESQRKLLNLMRDDIVSLDQNYVCKQAVWAEMTMPTGDRRNLAELLDHPVHQGFYGAAVASLTAITSAIVEDYAVNLDPADIAGAEASAKDREKTPA